MREGGQSGRMLRAAIGQLYLPVGDIAGNRDRIGATMAWAEEIEADVLVLPELAITGYPPEDLLHASAFVDENLAALGELAAQAGDCVSIVGFVDPVAVPPSLDSTPRTLANAVAILYRGRVRGRYRKVLLPNYGVFDERRYFEPGARIGGTWTIAGAEVGIVICEDIWRPDIPDAQAADGAQVLLAANASPYHQGKAAEREATITDVARRCGTPVVYAANVGGQDDVVFDGGSQVADAAGRIVARAPSFVESCFAVDLTFARDRPPPRRATFVCRPSARPKEVTPDPPPLVDPPGALEEVYRAIVLSLADFVRRHGYDLALIGLSGGVDSALVAALATDALGPERVWGVCMPGPPTPPEAITDAAELARRLGIRFESVDVTEPYKALGKAADAHFTGGDVVAANEGLLPRTRGALLLDLADRFTGVVLPTANKTEVAVGFATPFGDLAGSFAPLGDVPKTLVYELCRWRNSVDGRQFGWASGVEVIPEAIVGKAPSAERTSARPDRDLPASYPVVDAIIEQFVELARSPDEIVDAGFDRAVVQRVLDLVERNEPTRRQAPPSVKVTAKAFGRDRRVPLTHGFRPRITPPGDHRPDPGHAPDLDTVLEG
ncbi:MAG: NAD+ synthase [Egibacteraceae bacterium]